MTITFSQGQYFHPIYGWMNEDLKFSTNTNRNTIVELLSKNDQLKPGDKLYELLYSNTNASSIVKQMEENATHKADDPGPAYIYEKKDLSYYMDGYTESTGAYRFEYKDNTVTASVNFNDSSIKSTDPFERYEQHRSNILGLSAQGYNNQAISMLLNALDKEFLNSRRENIMNVLVGAGYNSAQAYDMMRAINSEYLRVRSDDALQSIEETVQNAVQNLKDSDVLNNKVDIDPEKMNSGQYVDGQHYITLELANKVRGIKAEQATRQAEINAEEAARNAPLKLGVTKVDDDYRIDPSEIHDTFGTANPGANHIRDIDKMRDYSNFEGMSDVEKEARSLSVVFRVRGDQMIDYAKRYEELSGEIDAKLKSNEISESEHERYRADLNTAFVKTYNLNIMGQAAAAGLSDEKAKELAAAFSEEYIKIREQTAPEDRNADKMANEALKTIAAQGWPEFSMYSNENRASADPDDPWYFIMPENALYYMNTH